MSRLEPSNALIRDPLAPLTPGELIADYTNYKSREQESSQRGQAFSNHVTALTHECEAYAIFNRIVPASERRMLDPELAMIFSEGRDQARIVKRDLLDAGYELQGEESQALWGKYQIVGHKDFALRKPGLRGWIRCELKSCNPFTFDKLDSPLDIRNHRSLFIRKWDRQVCLYMVLQSVDSYWLILKNKTSGQIKIIEYTLGDDELKIAEAMIAKAERVNVFVAENIPITDSQKLSEVKTCSGCEFLGACNPPLAFGPGASFLSGDEAAELDLVAKKHAELERGWTEYERLDSQIKETIKRAAGEESETVSFGDFVASVKRIDVKGKKQTRITWASVPIKK